MKRCEGSNREVISAPDDPLDCNGFWSFTCPVCFASWRCLPRQKTKIPIFEHERPEPLVFCSGSDWAVLSNPDNQHSYFHVKCFACNFKFVSFVANGRLRYKLPIHQPW